MERIWVALGALAGLGAVALSAYATHAGLDPMAEKILRAGVQMQGWHALALLFCGAWGARGGIWTTLAGAAYVLGLLLFCSAVYSLALAGRSLGVAAPIGGSLLMVGWALLFVSALRKR
jgi:uncharacterized membrane protein YgdD (TMEM256/DUF423 family)